MGSTSVHAKRGIEAIKDHGILTERMGALVHESESCFNKGEKAVIIPLLCWLKNSGAGWSSLAARRAHNPKVIGSNPIPATK